MKKIGFYAVALFFTALLTGFNATAAAFADIHGFVEAGAGYRTSDDPHEAGRSLSETRLQADLNGDMGPGSVIIKADFLYDDMEDDHSVDLSGGEGWLDLREFNFSFSPLDFMDLKSGRQILTWGTGDMIFINDMFPKDWVSFFSGRQSEYLKAPSDALKMSFFSPLINADAVYTPQFDSDRYITGERISYWNGTLGAIAGRNAVALTEKPDDWFGDSETALRLYRNFHGVETALYGYEGFWKSPAGMSAGGKAVFPSLRVLGVSARWNFLNGIANAEAGKYDSMDDRDGDNPMIRNGEVRFLAGYEHELMKNLMLSMQFYTEHIEDYGNYVSSLFPGVTAKDENRRLLTMRLTKSAMKQNLVMSAFVFYSPTDKDMYLRPKVSYQASDSLFFETGANIFGGENVHTFFGQFTENDNIYFRVKRGF
ncbi:MAG: hypothetical protein U9O97_03185 [Elusimicrobiota bacterium]|nr:hypothetical protein [Elusimicrobiota bacterium]